MSPPHPHVPAGYHSVGHRAGCSWWPLVLAALLVGETEGRKSSPGDTEARGDRVKSGCARTWGEDDAQHLTQVLYRSGSVSPDPRAAGAVPGADGAGAGTEGTTVEMLHTEAGVARKGSGEGMKIWERGLCLFFSPLPALGRMFWVRGSLPAVMFTEPVVISGAEIYVAF